MSSACTCHIEKTQCYYCLYHQEMKIRRRVESENTLLQQDNKLIKKRNKELSKRLATACNKIDLVKKGRKLNEAGEIV
ncbi:hypothetical protein BEH_11650 [Priestia filamentosa]|uniref:Uncharacterized protein n=1 Tax=Priestia filamentosa TaxID=1402861 RepID=A0A0H4KGK1_9BACI|nr:hypothetical protein [Priestia filamentosa]AKO92690.1 hypothetical protein BEH_11650 [Priestia filamentosa]